MFPSVSSVQSLGCVRLFAPLWIAACQVVKEKNGMDLTEADDIKKRWQEYTEELYQKGLHNPVNHDGMITHLEPDILECKVGLRKHQYEQS